MPDNYQLSLNVGGLGVGEVSLELGRTSGSECPELSAEWRNRTPFRPFGRTVFDLLPGWSWSAGECPPRHICVRAPDQLCSPEVQVIWFAVESIAGWPYHWQLQIVATPSNRTHDWVTLYPEDSDDDIESLLESRLATVWPGMAPEVTVSSVSVATDAGEMRHFAVILKWDNCRPFGVVHAQIRLKSDINDDSCTSGILIPDTMTLFMDNWQLEAFCPGAAAHDACVNAGTASIPVFIPGGPTSFPALYRNSIHLPQFTLTDWSESGVFSLNRNPNANFCNHIRGILTQQAGAQINPFSFTIDPIGTGPVTRDGYYSRYMQVGYTINGDNIDITASVAHNSSVWLSVTGGSPNPYVYFHIRAAYSGSVNLADHDLTDYFAPIPLNFTGFTNVNGAYQAGLTTTNLLTSSSASGNVYTIRFTDGGNPVAATLEVPETIYLQNRPWFCDQLGEGIFNCDQLAGINPVVERLQSGGARVCDEFQLVNAGVANHTLEFESSESGTIEADDGEAAIESILEAIIGSGDVQVHKTPTGDVNLYVVEFIGSKSNTDVSELVPSVGDASTVADGCLV